MNLFDRLVAIWKKEQPGEALPNPGMDRRRFLEILGASGAVAAAAPMLDLEALIWTPQSIVVVPDLGNVGVFLTADYITKEALRVLRNNLSLVNLINRHYGLSGLQSNFVLPDPRTQMPARIAISDVVAPIATHFEHAIPSMDTLSACAPSDCDYERQKYRGVTMESHGALSRQSPKGELARAIDRKLGVMVRAVKDDGPRYAGSVRIEVLGARKWA